MQREIKNKANVQEMREKVGGVEERLGGLDAR